MGMKLANASRNEWKRAREWKDGYGLCLVTASTVTVYRLKIRECVLALHFLFMFGSSLSPSGLLASERIYYINKFILFLVSCS